MLPSTAGGIGHGASPHKQAAAAPKPQQHPSATAAGVCARACVCMHVSAMQRAPTTLHLHPPSLAMLPCVHIPRQLQAALLPHSGCAAPHRCMPSLPSHLPLSRTPSLSLLPTPSPCAGLHATGVAGFTSSVHVPMDHSSGGASNTQAHGAALRPSVLALSWAGLSTSAKLAELRRAFKEEVDCREQRGCMWCIHNHFQCCCCVFISSKQLYSRLQTVLHP